MLCVVRGLLRVACCLLVVCYRILVAVCSVLCCCLFAVVRRLVFGVWCLVFIGLRVLLVAFVRYVLFAACWWSVVVGCCLLLVRCSFSLSLFAVCRL